MTKRYWGPIRGLGGTALVALVIGLLFPALSNSLFSEEARQGVLILAVPFVAFFITVLMVYMLVITLVVRYYNGRIPNRAHSPILNLLMVGILGGVVCLFQPFHIVGYRYGFILLLGSTLFFILWSHILPKSARLDIDLPKLTSLQHGIGLVAGAVVLIVLVAGAASVNAPREPYGERQRLWDRMSAEEQAAVATAATQDFSGIEVPFLIVLNLFPAALVYFIVREAAGAFVTGGTTTASAAGRLPVSARVNF